MYLRPTAPAHAVACRSHQPGTSPATQSSVACAYRPGVLAQGTVALALTHGGGSGSGWGGDEACGASAAAWREKELRRVPRGVHAARAAALVRLDRREVAAAGLDIAG